MSWLQELPVAAGLALLVMAGRWLVMRPSRSVFQVGRVSRFRPLVVCVTCVDCRGPSRRATHEDFAVVAAGRELAAHRCRRCLRVWLGREAPWLLRGPWRQPRGDA